MRKIKTLLIALVLIFALSFVIVFPTPSGNANIVLNNDFALSETTYTNISMDFESGDPYNGYSVWTYTIGGLQGPSDGSYVMDCDSGEYTFFGIDEFVNNSIVKAEVEFNPTEFSGGTYHYQPLGYFYQKTALESNTHWALVLYWSASGLRLYYNTGNGNTPSYFTLNTSTPKEDYIYTCFLYNFGTETYVSVIDITPLGDGIIYNDYVLTPTYDATSLYAGFGEYGSSGTNIWGRWDDFTVYDFHFDIPTDGYGFSAIDAYIDEEFAHTFYAIVSGYNSTLVIDSTVTNITLVIQCWLNGTTFNADTATEGKNIIRHNVTVTNTNNTIMFSQSNFTYVWGIEYNDDLFLYEYWVELDFTVAMGEIYKIVLQMEIFYLEVIE
jgi:hypothetical protein